MTLANKQLYPLKKTILVTDSGLGGMSVFARIAALLNKKSPWQDISLIYFNAWPEQNKGYNHFDTMDQRAMIFNNALNAMEKFKPDVILIACNTLSVIYPCTQHSQHPGTQVCGIVDIGVQLIHENLRCDRQVMADSDSHVIIFGTPTTIAQKTHQQKLMGLGIDPGRITSQGCTNLAGKIERNPFSPEVLEMIKINVSKAVSKIPQTAGKIYAALCCTHFGYCMDLFFEALSRHLKKEVIILNPNEKMADQVIESMIQKSPGKTYISSPDIDIKIVSKVFWEPQRIDAYIKLLKDISPQTVKALTRYEHKPNLFEVKS